MLILTLKLVYEKGVVLPTSLAWFLGKRLKTPTLSSDSSLSRLFYYLDNGVVRFLTH